MSGFLLDTTAISEPTRPAPNPGFRSWLESADPARLYLSVITIGELRRGVELLGPTARAAKLQSWLDSDVPAQFAGRILAFDLEAANRWGRMTAAASAAGVTLPAIDSLIAAIAMQHNLSVVTRNEKDFRPTGVSITNPWT